MDEMGDFGKVMSTSILTACQKPTGKKNEADTVCIPIKTQEKLLNHPEENRDLFTRTAVALSVYLSNIAGGRSDHQCLRND